MLELSNKPFKSTCGIHKDSLLSALNRLVLFIDPYDKNGVLLSFSDTELTIQSMKASAVEKLEYTASSDIEKYSCSVDISLLADIINAVKDDSVTIHF